ncbi:hypothetical protein BFP72_02330 [Reichenbachiella sp. 5M10]|uniref:hypothetical protein n=1 Tax=Reichenbachiella sp. 5M10 TaxID=1889772 RepID=UPI000C151918|nr:hypothetical protein [Reichenbachiella sp. 5M10]PIB34339.1 hypothetical protein BFP72_02330 [Reichenbachiella sp. 5M10]
MKTIHEAEDAVLEFDDVQSILVFTWKGVVSEASVTKVLTLAAKAAYMTESIHWLIDRRQLEAYDAGARIWVKTNFLNKVGKELIQKTDKIGAVMAHDPMAQVSSNVLIDLLIEQNKQIKFQEFDSPIPASNWLSGQTEEAPTPKKRRFF